MNIAQVNELLSKGFTAEFIMGLDSPVTAQNAAEETNTTPAPEPAPAPEAPQEAPAPAQEAPAQSSPPAAPGTELDRLFTELRNLTAAIQAGNRMSAEMGANIIDPQTAGREALSALGGLPTKNS